MKDDATIFLSSTLRPYEGPQHQCLGYPRGHACPVLVPIERELCRVCMSKLDAHMEGRRRSITRRAIPARRFS